MMADRGIQMMVDDKFAIKIAGIGDFGMSVLNDFGKRNLPGVECIDMNTDWAFKTANRFVKLGVNSTRGLGSGALVEFGKKAAEEDKQSITEAIKNCRLLIIVAGLGGGTGSGASPVVVTIAKKLKIPVIAFVTTPPDFEGKIRRNNACYCLKKLKSSVDVLFVLSNEKFLAGNFDRNTHIAEFYKETGEILKKNILKVVDLFNLKASKNKTIQEILLNVECDKAYYIEMFKTT